MDTVFNYKKELYDYLCSLPDNEVVVISIEQLLYLLVSDTPFEDNHLLNITKRILVEARKYNKASCSVKNLKSIYAYTIKSGMNEYINKEIYNLLVIDQLIQKNNALLLSSYDPKLNELNNGLIENYNTKKNNFLNFLLNN